MNHLKIVQTNVYFRSYFRFSSFFFLYFISIYYLLSWDKPINIFFIYMPTQLLPLKLLLLCCYTALSYDFQVLLFYLNLDYYLIIQLIFFFLVFFLLLLQFFFIQLFFYIQTLNFSKILIMTIILIYLLKNLLVIFFPL